MQRALFLIGCLAFPLTAQAECGWETACLPGLPFLPGTPRLLPTELPSGALLPAEAPDPSLAELTPLAPGTRALAPQQAVSVLGALVRAEDGSEIGRVVDVLASPGGAPVAAVLDAGGFLGVGNRKVAVSWQKLRFTAEDGEAAATTVLTPDAVRAAPEYREGQVVSVLQTVPPALPDSGATEAAPPANDAPPGNATSGDAPADAAPTNAAPAGTAPDSGTAPQATPPGKETPDAAPPHAAPKPASDHKEDRTGKAPVAPPPGTPKAGPPQTPNQTH